MLANRKSEALIAATRTNVYVDFDGTIAPDDPTDALFARFAEPEWLEIEQEWQQGRLTSRECMARQVALLRATPAEFQAFVATIKIDPDFPRFARLCQRNRMGVLVVSDGLDALVGAVLRAAGLDLRFVANRLAWAGGDRWALNFPHMRPDCHVNMGNCKCAHAGRAGGARSVMVGDGRSDFCIAERCDLVLAKGKLADHCRRERLPHVAIDTFRDATLALWHWIGRDAPAERQLAIA